MNKKDLEKLHTPEEIAEIMTYSDKDMSSMAFYEAKGKAIAGLNRCYSSCEPGKMKEEIYRICLLADKIEHK